MDATLLLVKIISLVYWATLGDTDTMQSRDIGKQALALVKIPEQTLVSEFTQKDPMIALYHCAQWMLSTPHDYRFDPVELYQRLQLAAGHDQDLANNVLLPIIKDAPDAHTAPQRCLAQRNTLYEQIRRRGCAEVIKKLDRQITFQPETVDWDNLLREVNHQLEPFTITQGVGKKPSYEVGSVDFSDLASLTAAVEDSMRSFSENDVLKFGKQGINRMLGKVGGLQRGKLMSILAPPYEYKSGQCLDAFIAFCMYNKPHLDNPNKRPLILHLSLENDVPTNLKLIYERIYEMEFRLKSNYDEIGVEEAAEYVKSRLERNGFVPMMRHYEASVFSIYNFKDLIEQLESEGFEIIACCIDYPYKMGKQGLRQGATGDDILDLFAQLRSFINKKRIACLVPHQMSTEARKLIRDGAEGEFVRDIAQNGYYQNCKALDTELDIELVQHIVKVGDDSYMTMMRGKHRGINDTPASDMYCVYKFEPVGGLIDDIDGPDMSRKRVGASARSEGDKPAWWDNSEI